MLPSLKPRGQNGFLLQTILIIKRLQILRQTKNFIKHITLLASRRSHLESRAFSFLKNGICRINLDKFFIFKAPSFPNS